MNATLGEQHTKTGHVAMQNTDRIITLTILRKRNNGNR
jgi:hypothetical protein